MGCLCHLPPPTCTSKVSPRPLPAAERICAVTPSAHGSSMLGVDKDGQQREAGSQEASRQKKAKCQYRGLCVLWEALAVTPVARQYSDGGGEAQGRHRGGTGEPGWQLRELQRDSMRAEEGRGSREDGKQAGRREDSPAPPKGGPDLS